MTFGFGLGIWQHQLMELVLLDALPNQIGRAIEDFDFSRDKETMLFNYQNQKIIASLS
jgi:hypothetical protein